MSSINVGEVAAIYRKLLVVLGQDATSEGLTNTPMRVANMWKEFLEFDPGNVDTTFSNIVQSQLVIVRDIPGWSLCQHHLLPFSFTAHVGYLTGPRVLGLSKIPRIVAQCSHKLQLQEYLTQEIAEVIVEHTKSDTVGVVLIGSHTCMSMRGIQSPSQMVTSCMLGTFMANPILRQEFLTLIQDS